MRAPISNYLLIGGVPKSATTSLFRYLSDHPQICPANQKETYFFAREFDYSHVCKLPATLEGFEQYFSHCTKPGRLRLEATPYTLYAPYAAKQIASLLPDARVLFILRDPLKRLLSDYHFHLQREHPHTSPDFEIFIDRQMAHKASTPTLIDLGCYAQYLSSYFDAIPHEQIIILFFEDFVADQHAVIQNLCLQLDIQGDYYQNYTFVQHNPTISVRHTWLNRSIMKMEPVSARLRQLLVYNPRLLSLFERLANKSRRFLFTINQDNHQPQSKISTATLAKLREFYQPHNQALSDLLKRQLPW